MKKKVYIARGECDLLKEKLEENNVDVLIKEGPYDDNFLHVCDALVPGKIPITSDILKKAPNLKIISKFGVGMDRIDISACSEKGIYVCNTPRSNYISVAEQTITLLLMAAKKIWPITRRLKENGEWDAANGRQGQEVSGKTISVIGLGNIGRYVANLAHGFGMNVKGFDPYTNKDIIPEYISISRTLEEALSSGDFITLHVAGIDSNRKLIGRNELLCMKPTAILINTTRGFVIDEEALIDALKNGTIAGAALDVFEEEPIQKDNPLLKMDNVIATPHMSANTVDSWLRTQEQTAENILKAFNGEVPENTLNNTF